MGCAKLLISAKLCSPFYLRSSRCEDDRSSSSSFKNSIIVGYAADCKQGPHRTPSTPTESLQDSIGCYSSGALFSPRSFRVSHPVSQSVYVSVPFSPSLYFMSDRLSRFVCLFMHAHVRSSSPLFCFNCRPS